MNTETEMKPTAPAEAPDGGRCAVESWLGTNDHVRFAASLRKLNAKLRKGCRQTIDRSDLNATEWPINDHPCIEVKQGKQWLLLKMPSGTVFFKSFEERDRVFDALPNGRDEPRGI